MPNALLILVYIRHTGRALSNEATIEYIRVWITGNVPEFIGADGSHLWALQERRLCKASQGRC